MKDNFAGHAYKCSATHRAFEFEHYKCAHSIIFYSTEYTEGEVSDGNEGRRDMERTGNIYGHDNKTDKWYGKLIGDR